MGHLSLVRTSTLATLLALIFAPAGLAQNLSPTYANIAYAAPAPVQSRGHLLDLYIPVASPKPVPVVIWSQGSAWMSDAGKEGAGAIAAQLIPAGYAVAGVSIRSSRQVTFPGQLYDIKAAIRWIRANAVHYNIDPKRIAIMGGGDSGWAAAIAATTGDTPGLEGRIGATGVSSAVQAAIAFYPPTDFLAMDAWALRRCNPASNGPPDICHDGKSSPESQLLGCAIQTCAARARTANPARYVTARTPPMMILHGEADPLVPHSQGELLYQALNKACRDAVFISLPKGGHGSLGDFLTPSAYRQGATVRSTAAVGCVVKTPDPVTPSWATVVEFLDQHLKG